MTPPPRGVSRRALAVGIGMVLATQAATVFVVHRMTSRAAAVAEAQRPVAPPSRPAGEGDRARSALIVRAPPPPLPAAVQGTPEPRTEPVAATKGPPLRKAWSDRPLDDGGVELAAEVGCTADDLRLLADRQGRLSDATRRDLLAGRDTGRRVALDLGLSADGEDRVAQIMVGFMVRRVTMRESFRDTAVTPQAIDDAARADALAMVAQNLDEQAKDAVQAALPGLPDLTADVPPSAR